MIESTTKQKDITTGVGNGVGGIGVGGAGVGDGLSAIKQLKCQYLSTTTC
jgi:hypothetical protein